MSEQKKRGPTAGIGGTMNYQTTYKPLDWFKDNPENYRRHPPEQVAVLQQSLQRFGVFRNVVARPDGTLLAGHGIVAAARAEGLEEFPCVVFEGTDEEARALMVADNEQARLAEDDAGQLAKLLEGAQGAGMLQVTGHDAESLQGLLCEVDRAAEHAELGDDGPPETPAEAATKRGDVWVCGEHRVVCGDSAEESSYAGCETAQLVATSPPYAAQRDYYLVEFSWDEVVPQVIAKACGKLAADGSALVNLGLIYAEGKVVEYWRSLFVSMEEQGRPLFGWYVWDKLKALPGDWDGRLAPAHEWVFHFANKPRRPRKTKECVSAGRIMHKRSKNTGFRRKDGTQGVGVKDGHQIGTHRIPDSVIRALPQAGGIEGHPAPFSVAFATELVQPYTVRGETVIDPFLGSGTTLIACEQLGRICYGIEIEPRYVDIAVLRWQKLTGQKATLEATGEPFPA